MRKPKRMPDGRTLADFLKDPFKTVREKERQQCCIPVTELSALPIMDEVDMMALKHDETVLPTDAAARKAIPMASGVLDYFPAALAEVAKVSVAGNNQHNPGQDLHWSRGKSQDFADTIMRHLVDRGKVDSDGIRHSAKLAWRALALLQIEMEEAGAPKARGAR